MLPLIAPSLLSADFSKLGEELRAIEPFADRLHLDIMDGHFVPNISFGPGLIKSIRPHTRLLFEAHLMIAPVQPYLKAIKGAGADIILVHLDGQKNKEQENPYTLVREIKGLGCKAGVVLNPETPLSSLLEQEELLKSIDQVLVMAVNPGFGGQKFIPNALDRLKAIAPFAKRYGFLLEVDGGINHTNAKACRDAGADILVAGTAVFSQQDYALSIKKLKGEI